MLRKLTFFTGVMLLLVLPVSGSQFPEQLPSMSKEEAESLGLVLTLTNNQGGWEGSNFVKVYQSFVCSGRNGSVNNYIWVMMVYYTDNGAVDFFRQFVEEGRKHSTESVVGPMSYANGGKEGYITYRYKFNEEPDYADLRTVKEAKYFDGSVSTLIEHTYAAFVGHYSVYGGASYYEGTNSCDLEGLLPILINMYLSKIPDSTVRIPVNTSQAGSSEEKSSENKATLTITAPSDGQRFTSSSGFGLFVIGVKAKFSGDGKDLYAVVTSPDGSRSRAKVYGDGTIEDLVILENTGLSEPKTGTIEVEVYGTADSKEKLLASGSVEIVLANDEEKPGDMVDNDGDGLVDCDDPDIAACDECVLQKKLEWAESIMKRHLDYLEKVKSLHPEYASLYDAYEDDLREIHDRYKDDPDRMVVEMNAYMDRKVYGQQRIRSLLSIFKDDPEKRYQLRQISEKYRYDPVKRDIEMENFIYKHAKDEAERAAVTNLILTGILQPPKWLVGGQYGSGGVLDWSKFVADNFEKVGNAVRLKGAEKVKFFTTPAGVYMVALDAKALLDHANDLKNMNLPDNAKVSIIVLDGATKIGKLLDPTGYFGNMADATVGAVINLRKKIEERNQGWFTWNGYVLHETAIPGIYEDYETGKKFRRVGGGWFRMNFVEVEGNG